MSNVAAIVVPDDSALDEVKAYPVKEPGVYTMEIVDVETVFVKSGKHEGKPALNLTLQHPDGPKVWKQIPLWAAPTDQSVESRKERDWLRMSRKALVDSLGITNADLVNNTDKLIGEVVEAKLGIQNSATYGEQNFVVTFMEIGK